MNEDLRRILVVNFEQNFVQIERAHDKKGCKQDLDVVETLPFNTFFHGLIHTTRNVKFREI